MDIRDLEVFAATMSLGSITEAGKLLGRSQPMVSRIIQQMEEQVGYLLFERSGPRVKPTLHAVRLYSEVEQILGGFRRFEEIAYSIGTGEKPSISIIATPALGAGLIPEALARIGDIEELPDDIRLQTTSAENIVGALLAGSVDFAVSSLPFEHKGLDNHWVGEAPCVAVLSVYDPLSDEKVIQASQLATRRILTLKNNRRLRRRFDSALAKAGVVPTQLLETSQSINAIMGARQILGVALVDPVTAYGLPMKDVVVKPLDIYVPFYFGAFTASDYAVNQLTLGIMDQVRQVASDRLANFQCHAAGSNLDLSLDI